MQPRRTRKKGQLREFLPNQNEDTKGAGRHPASAAVCSKPDLRLLRHGKIAGGIRAERRWKTIVENLL